jgi:hypothetical protein
MLGDGYDPGGGWLGDGYDALDACGRLSSGRQRREEAVDLAEYCRV